MNTNGFGNVNNQSVICLTVHDGQLFAGTLNTNEGCEVYREIATVFIDGFESGDTTAWSATVP